MAMLERDALGRLWRRLSASAAMQRPPIVVELTAKAGRGVFATRDIAQGELIHSADPVVVHPTLDNVSKVCYSCLKLIDQQLMPAAKKDYVDSLPRDPRGVLKRVSEPQVLGGRLLPVRSEINNSGETVLFCGPPCAENAKRFSVIENRGNWSELHHYCRENNLKFPLVARRLACMVIAGVVSSDALEILSQPLLPNGNPLQWNEERDLLVKTLKGAAVQQRLLEWIISRLHINAFAVEMINTSNCMDLLEATASSVLGDAQVGTAVYILPSLYNHDCDPNVNIRWPGNSIAKLEARRMIKAGEELRITYLDASLAHDARQEILRESYGFSCDCPRCRDLD